MKRAPLQYRSIGGEHDPWPAWLLALKHACGVYVIRDSSTGSTLYVGSSKARLYHTVTRHFQQWKRHKQWWKGQYGAGHDPGLTYRRGRCVVAVRLTTCDERLAEEARLISRLQPRDNLTEHPDGDLAPAPF